MPSYRFDYGDKLAVKNLIIEWNSPAKTIGVVATTLVTKNPGNYGKHYQICSFVKPHNVFVTEVEFVNPTFYRVAGDEMQDAKITIEPMFEKTIPEIKNAYIQLIVE